MAPKAPQSLYEAAESGDRRLALEALRRTLVAAIEADPPPSARDLAALSARLVDVLTQLGDGAPEEADKVDDLAAGRAKRRAASGQ